MAAGEADTLTAADDARAADALEAFGAETPVAAPAEQDERQMQRRQPD